MQEKKYIAAMMDHFGKLPGQDLRAFADEVKMLTDKDRLDFRMMFADEGINITNLSPEGKVLAV